MTQLEKFRIIFIIYLFTYLPSPKDIFSFHRDRVRGGGRNIDVKKKQQSVAFLHAPQAGIKPATWLCALTGNRTCDLSIYGPILQLTEPHQQDFHIIFRSMWF